MLNKIHRPKLLYSGSSNESGNRYEIQSLSGKAIVTTEHWDVTPSREWRDAGVITAQKGYTWITKWELGAHSVATKILDEKQNLVGIYWDITSKVEKMRD